MHEAYQFLSSEVRRIDSNLKGTAYLLSPERRRFDRYASMVLATATAPLVVAACTAVRLQDGHAALIQLPRVGLGGEIFGQYKVRSMHPDADRQTAPRHRKSPHDPRITPIGKFLRKHSIDELPQFHNVWDGSMSLVAASRPISQAEYEWGCKADKLFGPGYVSMRPGMTGHEQINGRGNCTPEERIEFVKCFTEEASPGLDRHILLRTARVLLNQDGAF